MTDFPDDDSADGDAFDDDPIAEPPDELLGTLVAGRFQVEALIGKGGVGRVYRAKQLELSRPIALKVLHPHMAALPDMKERFAREARAASMLQHPHSVVVYDFGQWEGRLYIAMELLTGHPLSDVLTDLGVLPPDRIAVMLSQVLDVLQVAHGQGLLHRDLKPENVLVLQDPRANADGEQSTLDYTKVVDFGLARLMDPESDMRLTRDGGVSGTPAYMSPEQARGTELDARSDLYSVGVMLYEMLCGDCPFDGNTALDVLLKHLYAEAIPPSHRAPQLKIDPGLEAICMRAMSKSPDDRFADAAAMRQAIEAAVSGEGADGDAGHHIKKLSRADRGSAVGLSDIAAPAVRPEDREAVRLIVVQPRDVDFASSAGPVLKAHGIRVEELIDLETFAATALDYDAVIVDLRPDPAAQLASIETDLDSWELEGRPLLVLGPDGAFELMQRALHAGVEDYVPLSKLTKLPQKARRAIRRSRRKTQRGAAKK